MMRLFKILFGARTSSKELIELLENGAIVVDVRTPGEFKRDHAKISINISEQKIPLETERLKKENKPIIICCRNGARSQYVQKYLEKAGIDCINAGSWKNIKNLS
ncbi:rhodanese-like domain-containing protein [Schleiferiaceae bacterium]|nr:rhodanese-like domain-containing protein [Schleiferiaceae bacterium]